MGADGTAGLWGDGAEVQTPADRELNRGGRRLRLGFVLDVAGFGLRTSPNQHEVQRRLRQLVQATLAECGLALDRLIGGYQWTGDGINVMLPIDMDPALVLPVLIRSMAAGLGADNARSADRIRLRMAIGVGLVEPSVTGFNGPLIVDINRLVSSDALRGALSDFPVADLAVAISDHAFDLVIQPGYPGIPAGQFATANVAVKEFSEPAWIWVSARQWSEPAYAPLTPADPSEIGGYRIVARLGRGTAGRVYLAAGSGVSGGPGISGGSGGRAPAHWAAVKVFDQALAADEDTRRRLITGALAASVLSGDHLAAVVSSDPRASQPWVASALVRGPSLASTVTETGPLPADAVGWMTLSLASALATLHKARLTHRAVHPHNVLLDADGPVLTDLGINRNTLTAGPGTAADDVFSLGSTAYYAATGRTPCDKYQAGQIPPAAPLGEPSGVLAGCPPLLAPILEACVDSDPSLRPTAAELQIWLATVIGKRPRSWLPEPVAARLSEYRRKI
jgi:hypothetical protein